MPAFTFGSFLLGWSSLLSRHFGSYIYFFGSIPSMASALISRATFSLCWFLGVCHLHIFMFFCTAYSYASLYVVPETINLDENIKADTFVITFGITECRDHTLQLVISVIHLLSFLSLRVIPIDQSILHSGSSSCLLCIMERITLVGDSFASGFLCPLCFSVQAHKVKV